MSSLNLDLVRSICAAWGRGDWSSAEWAHPEIEYVLADGPARGSWKGLAGMAEGWRKFLEAWEGFRAVPDEYRELDDERVLVLQHAEGRGKTSGVEVGGTGATGATLFCLRAGKVTRLVVYADRELALADVGLSSESRSTKS